MKITTADAFSVLKQALQDDPDYAHSWHANIAMSCMDAMDITDYQDTHKRCNEGAARFMKTCFDVETSQK